MPGNSAQADYLLHLVGGKLTEATLPGGWQRYFTSWISRVPGADHELAAGYIHPKGNPETSTTAVVLQYS
jgi:hypothetical protein